VLNDQVTPLKVEDFPKNASQDCSRVRKLCMQKVLQAKNGWACITDAFEVIERSVVHCTFVSLPKNTIPQKQKTATAKNKGVLWGKWRVRDAAFLVWNEERKRKHERQCANFCFSRKENSAWRS